jgi:[glutamine synthetase] adenylyltransferase / [glutamine synthetase]-adenylyl-L-tyrosine phosphorylase
MTDDPAAEAARLVARLGPKRLAAADLAVEAGWASDPHAALARVGDLPGCDRVLPELGRAERIALFVLLAGSAHLARVLTADPAWDGWLRRAVRGEDDVPRISAADLAAVGADDPAAAARVLRRWRQRAYLRLGARDLWGLAPIEETLAVLSDVAESAISAATAEARRQVEHEYGRLRLEDGRPNRFGVLGMGKLGACELNYSSDVDLIFLHESDGSSSERGTRGSLPALAWFTRLAERLTKLLSEVTEDGFVFRVDLRLRPDGMNGPLTSSLAATLGYYESFGQTWERAALFKARPVGGDRDLAESFLEELAPFVYRRTLDYTMIADLEQMKARVDEQVQSKGDGSRNVKLGPGGIREVEFLAESFALVHGGRDRRLRERATLVLLRRLVELGLLEAAEGEALADAYRWLRRVEHALQIDEERQLHILPADPPGRTAIARRLGLHLDGDGAVWQRAPGGDAISRFEGLHEHHTAFVQGAFDELFRSRRTETFGLADAQARDLLDDLDRPDVEARVAALGFSDPAGAVRALRSIRDGVPHSRPESRSTVLALAPALLHAVRESPRPDRALATLAEFLGRVGARRTTTALLAENPGTLRLLVNLFATSEYLSRVLIQHPELLDTLVRSDLVLPSKGSAAMAQELATQLAQATDFEQQLDVLRRFRSDEMLRIGVHDVQGELHYTAVSDQLSALADACLRAAYEIAVAERNERFGRPAGLGLAVMALGKLGSEELNYHSDLDLIFVYGPSEHDHPSTDAAERWAASGLGPQEFFGKVAQLLMLVLQVGTREGIVYKIDTRLRPSGRSGTLVTSLEAFARYHEASSAVWERQALVRARVVCGPPDLARRVSAVVEGFVYGRGLSREEREEIARMRRRLERELARESREFFNLKTGRGGLVDIEFIAQAGALEHGHDRPALRERGTRRLLEGLGAAGLLSEADCATLVAAHAFLRGLENRLRIEGEHPIERIARDPISLAPAARRMGISGDGAEAGRRLIEEYDRRSAATREVYDRLLGRRTPAES